MKSNVSNKGEGTRERKKTSQPFVCVGLAALNVGCNSRPSSSCEIFAIWSLLKTFFYKKTYGKTFAENRLFLGVLEHDAKV